MAIPIIYNLRSVRVRWVSSIVAVAGIAGAVGVFIAMLALAEGFETVLATAGTPRNVILTRAGATSEMESAVTLAHARLIGDAPGIALGADNAPLVSGEVFVVTALPKIGFGTDANVSIRGVSPLALQVHDIVHVTEGRFFTPGTAEVVVGRGALRTIEGLGLGAHPRFGGREWTVVGIFDAEGSAFESDVWCDARLLNESFDRPSEVFQSITARLVSESDFTAFKDAVTSNPQLNVSVQREDEYFASRSETLSTMIRSLGSMIAFIMGIGSLFAALNTMYSAVAARVREIATLRALGFGPISVVVSFVFEALLIAGVGGLVGCLLTIPINGYGVSTMNWQTFSHLAFAFHVTPLLLLRGMIFALIMGFFGGLFPAIRAARLPVATALRDL